MRDFACRQVGCRCAVLGAVSAVGEPVFQGRVAKLMLRFFDSRLSAYCEWFAYAGQRSWLGMSRSPGKLSTALSGQASDFLSRCPGLPASVKQVSSSSMPILGRRVLDRAVTAPSRAHFHALVYHKSFSILEVVLLPRVGPERARFPVIFCVLTAHSCAGVARYYGVHSYSRPRVAHPSYRYSESLIDSDRVRMRLRNHCRMLEESGFCPR